MRGVSGSGARRLALLVVGMLAACRMTADEEPGTSPAPAATTAVEPATRPASPSTAMAPPRAAPPSPSPESEGLGWNAAQIDWQPFDAALGRAKADHKPVCLVFYTSWCPHCRAFSHVFEDPRIAERAKSFSMVRLDADKEPELAARYAPDGPYIPRTFFLSGDGVLDESVRRDRPKYQYFYDERDPGSLLAAMDQALTKRGR
jgi:thiol-disulfide isomerase/thioredoxin